MAGTLSGVSDTVMGGLMHTMSMGSRTKLVRNADVGFKNVGSRAHGEFVPACGIDRTTHFEEKKIKEKVWRNVLNLETTVLPNAWGSKVGWMFYPKSDFLNYWETLLAVLVIYVAFMEPIRVGFSIETSAVKGGGLYWFEMAVDILFITDLFVCMRTCFFVKDEWENLYLVQDKQQIRDQYLRSWFFLDLIAVFPTAYILEIAEAVNSRSGLEPNAKNTLKFILRLVRLTKLFRLRRIGDLMARLEHTFPKVFESYVLIKMGFAIMYMAHILACLWYLCGVTGGENGWVEAVKETADVDSLSRMYLMSFYWSFTTMTTVGFGDITGTTGIEQAFSTVAMGIGGFTFALIVGSIGDLITRNGVAETAYLQMMGELKEFLKAKSATKELTWRMISFHERLYSSRTVFDEGTIMKRLPKGLRRDMVMHMYSRVLRRVPLFMNLSDLVIQDVCMQLKAYHAAQGEAFTVEGEWADKMFIVRNGMIRLTFQGEELRSSPMKGGDFFGVICLAGLADTRPYTTTAMRQCELCTLSRNDMRRLVAQHPQIGDVVMEFARQRLREITQDVNEAKTTIEHTKSRKDVVRRMREGTDVGLELASMTDMKGKEVDATKTVAAAKGAQKRANELFDRIHLARYVATNGPKERWNRGLMKLKKGGRIMALMAAGAGGDANGGGASENGADADAPGGVEVAPVLDELLSTSGASSKQSLGDVKQSVKSGLGLDAKKSDGGDKDGASGGGAGESGGLRGVSDKVASSNPVLAAIATISGQLADQQRAMHALGDRVEAVVMAVESMVDGDIDK